MKRILRTGVFLLMLFMVAGAAANDRYAVRVFGEYNYNYTWSHYADVAVQGIMPFNEHFVMKANAEASTANLYSVSLSLQPRFPVKKGEFFISTDLWYRAVVRNRINDISAALSMGYRMDYVSVQLGWLTRIMNDMDRNWHTTDQIMAEPLNLLYEIKVWVRPQTSKWNLSLSMANFDDFQTERMYQPIFQLGAWVNLSEHLQILMGAELKPTGMFHLDASFYAASAKFGIGYNF